MIPGGLSSLLDPLVATLGPRFLTARVAVLVKARDGGGAVVRAVNAEDAIVTDYDARAVVLAVPPFVASRIAPALQSPAPRLAAARSLVFNGASGYSFSQPAVCGGNFCAFDPFCQSHFT